ncbi:gamma-glutamyltransferase family protein [Desemzia incerta]|uniref:gamma-glutamyltransferase family protein n=1 Tax=Desemzia incerta TaxID=82801 RepID=UPI0033161D92
MKYDSGTFHYSSRRELVYGKKGMVSTTHPLASQAGLEVLKKGGNAIDAIVAAAAALTVVEPSANGIGGDSFAIIWYKGEMYGLNSSGAAPELMKREAFQQKGTEIPRYGLEPVTVPGVPKGWASLINRFGRLSLSEVMEPAAVIAEEGHPVTSKIAEAWERTYQIFSKQLKDYPVLQTWFDTFCPDGKPLQAGDMWSSKGHAKTLREIGATDAEAFYTGWIADEIDAFSKKYDGYIRKKDLEQHQVEWITPLSTAYKGYDIWEMPPNGQGIIVLMALNILEELTLKDKESPDTYHKQIEAIKLAFSDGLHYISDPRSMRTKIEDMLSKEYATSRAGLITKKALLPEPGKFDNPGTVYLAAADGEGNMVSYIQSNYAGFGSGSVVPGLGISLHNRGNQFSLDENHPNVLAPGKRPFHTIIPGFITQNGKPIGPFGVMGGGMQPQAHLQVLSSMIDFQLNPQDALDAPRWQWLEGKKVLVEPQFPYPIIQDLIKRGHEVQIAASPLSFGRGQIILQQENGVLVGGTEPRADGHIAVW